jgi:hypothetical protein
VDAPEQNPRKEDVRLNKARGPTHSCSFKELGRIGACKWETLTLFNPITVQRLPDKKTPWEWESVKEDTMAG